MRFWDTSAIGPLLWEEPNTPKRIKELELDPLMVVWWGTLVEVESALCRRLSRDETDSANGERARSRLKVFSEAWVEIEPSYLLREMARRLIRVHGLKSADSLQLAAALVACGNDPQKHTFLTDDQVLKNAALKEGFICP